MHLSLKSLAKEYTVDKLSKAAFENIDLEIAKGEFVAVVGPSGCGKTTLLRVIAGLEKASQGEIRFSSSAPNIAMVFQEHGLFPWMSLKKNFQIILENNGAIPKENINEITNHYFNKIGLLDYLDYYPHQVSGGMRQRVNVARSFANQPEILLMDEPFVFLDYQTRLSLHELLMQIWQESQQTVVFVTHDIEEAVLLADRVVLLSQGPGQIVKIYTITIKRPRDILGIRQMAEFHEPVNEIIAYLKSNKNG